MILPAADRPLRLSLERSLVEARLRAGAWLACRVGCTECCQGPFPITALDARRLQHGLVLLARRDPARARAVQARAEAQAAVLAAADFPGDPRTGALGEDEAAEERFCAEHARRPCPALDPARGTCDLYEWRPVSCRTFGPPVVTGGEPLPPCRLCFVGAPQEEVDRCRVGFDREGREDALLARLAAGGVPARETLVAFALLPLP